MRCARTVRGAEAARTICVKSISEHACSLQYTCTARNTLTEREAYQASAVLGACPLPCTHAVHNQSTPDVHDLSAPVPRSAAAFVLCVAQSRQRPL